MSPSSRKQFEFPAPGLPRFRDDEKPESYDPPAPSEDTPVDTFALVVLHAHTVDLVDLRANQRIKFKHGQDGTWEELEINP